MLPNLECSSTFALRHRVGILILMSEEHDIYWSYCQNDRRCTVEIKVCFPFSVFLLQTFIYIFPKFTPV